MFCESDQASLCWHCDAEVHSANFLVAKHTRTLLCQSCQALTPWTGSGPKLGPTLSVCESCVHNNHTDDDEEDEDDGDEDEDEEEEEEEEKDDGENQVVPLASSSPAPPQMILKYSSGE
ncbi:B-box domain protein 31 [Heracleum sosnowskyi]|uniref:B-box domain protein 31 n=1 Tax=Heracleum sosnowskyi TaxID=360622 RepID=A0AAD8HJS0_9APIA|nr:B-box domain protein 31 [Heracleum sosnowskyi]